MPINSLEKFGFSPKESKIYLTALELGSSSVIQIAQKARINRGTTYDILESLIKKGLISYFIKGKKRYFAAEKPERLLDVLENQRKELLTKEEEIEKRQQEIKELLPELRSIYNLPTEKPKVRFFEGKEGILNIYEEILQETDEVWFYGAFKDLFHVFPNFISMIKRQIKAGLKIRDLVTRSKEALKVRVLYKKPKQEMRFLPKGLGLTTDNMIYGNKFAMISFGQKMHGVVIESREIVQTQRKIFEILWEKAEKV